MPFGQLASNAYDCVAETTPLRAREAAAILCPMFSDAPRDAAPSGAPWVFRVLLIVSVWNVVAGVWLITLGMSSGWSCLVIGLLAVGMKLHLMLLRSARRLRTQIHGGHSH